MYPLEMSTENSIKYYPNNLRSIRKHNNLSLHSTAKLLKTTATQIKRLEEGERTLTLDWAIRLAVVLKCTPEDILGKEIKDNESIYKIKRSISIIIPYYQDINNIEEKSAEIVVDKEWIRLGYNIENFDGLFLTDAPNDVLSIGIKKGVLILCYKTKDFILGASVYLIKEGNFIKVKKLRESKNNQIIMARVLASVIKY